MTRTNAHRRPARARRAEPAGLSPDGEPSPTCCAAMTPPRTRRSSPLWITDARGGARAADPRDGGAAPPWSPDGTVHRLPARRPALDAAGRRRRARSSSPPCRSAPVRRSGARAARASPSRRRSTRSRGQRGRRGARPPRGRADRHRRRRLPGRRRRLPAHDCARSCTWSTSRPANCRQLTDGDEHAGAPAWSPGRRHARLHRPPRRASTSSPCAPSGPPHRRRRPEGAAARWSPSRTASPAPSPSPRRGRPRRRRLDRRPGRAHAGLLRRRPLDGGEVTELAASLDRNVMPGAPAYPGALPQFTDDGRRAVRDPRPRLHAPLRGAVHRRRAAPRPGGDGPRRQRALGRRRQRRDRARPPRPRSARSWPSTWAPAPRPWSPRTATPRRRRPVRPREREFTISDGVTVQGWVIRDPERRPAPTPLLLDMHGGPHNAWNAAADEMHLYHQELAARGWTVLHRQPARQRRLRRRVLRRRLRRLGRGRRERLPRADRPARRRGYRRPGAARGHRLQLRRLHDLLPDQPRRPVRGGRRRRGRRRPDQHGRHQRRRRTSSASPSSARCPGRRRPRASRRDVAATPTSTRCTTPTLVLHGGDDVRCPVGQAEQWHSALRERGVPTRLVLYPGASPCLPAARQAVATGSTSTGVWSTGWSSTPVTQRARGPSPSTPRTGSGASPRSPSGTRSPAPSSASCASATAGRTRS